jgi:hypothetical protein
MKEKLLGYVIHNLNRDEYYSSHLNNVEIEGFVVELFCKWNPNPMDSKIFDSEFLAQKTIDTISKGSSDIIEVWELWDSRRYSKTCLPGQKAH